MNLRPVCAWSSKPSHEPIAEGISNLRVDTTMIVLFNRFYVHAHKFIMLLA